MEQASLIVHLEGPLQSYRSEISYSNSKIPTKTAVAGMIACALGLAKTSFDDFSGRDQVLSHITKFHVIVVEPGIVINDLQTTGGHNVHKRLLEFHGKKTYGAPTVANGIQKFPVMADVPYIFGGSFDVVVEFDTSEYATMALSALLQPRWPVYLGRSCAMPSMPLVTPLDQPIQMPHSTIIQQLLNHEESHAN